MTINIEKLRKALFDYYGSAAHSGLPMALIELSNVECASGYELIGIAKKAGFNLADYAIDDDFEK